MKWINFTDLLGDIFHFLKVIFYVNYPRCEFCIGITCRRRFLKYLFNFSQHQRICLSHYVKLSISGSILWGSLDSWIILPVSWSRPDQSVCAHVRMKKRPYPKLVKNQIHWKEHLRACNERLVQNSKRSYCYVWAFWEKKKANLIVVWTKLGRKF